MVDASALLHAVARHHPIGVRVQERLEADSDQHAPQVVKAEALSGLRRMAMSGEVAEERAVTITQHINDALLETYPVEAFVGRIWGLRDNLSVYDAWYVALAEALQVPLVTTDGRLERAPGIECEIELIS